VNAVELYIAEALAVHAILDDLGAPREYDGQKLSMSQRLEMIRKDIKGSPVTSGSCTSRRSCGAYADTPDRQRRCRVPALRSR
jgi:hypothetical protein